MGNENNQAWQGLITTLKKRKKIPLKEIPRGDGQNKLVRCNNSIPWIKSGQVMVPMLYDDEGKKITHTTYSNGSVAGPTSWVPAGLKEDRKSTRLNSSHVASSYAVFCLSKKR